ncbi:MAG: YhcH/YjgK/YiaL family protein [Candidatus Omnitrophica bacterium]|nr:YhcH/YjgK/YiaL family protein [Candidatus Omnitrophota bacterium]
MIFDEISYWENYAFGQAWEKAFAFLKSLSPEAEEKEYPIDGDDIFARVMSYETKPREEADLEAHMKYVDIQTVLSGSEGMEWAPTPQPELKGPYDEDNDIMFFHRSPNPPGRIIVQPGLFAAFFPQDAHMPQLIAAGDKPERVKKVVIKIRRSLLK